MQRKEGGGGRPPSRFIAVDNEPCLYATVYDTPSSPPLLALSPLHLQEAEQRRARRSEYDISAIAAAVPDEPNY